MPRRRRRTAKSTSDSTAATTGRYEMSRGQRLIVLLMALSCGISACTTRSPATNTEPSRYTWPTRSTTTSHTLPPIASPLDAIAYKMKPCELVTKEQTAAYSLNHAVPSRGGDHFQDCLWEGLASSQFKLMWLRFYYDTNWLARIYRNEAEPYYHDWVPLTIA